MNDWTQLGAELWRRTIDPWRRPNFVIYFIMASAGSAIGIWMAFAQRKLLNSKGDSIASDKTSVSIDATKTSTDITTDLTTRLYDDALFFAVVTYFPAIGISACLLMIIAKGESGHARGFATFLLFLLIVTFLLCLLAFYTDANRKFPTLLCFLGVLLALYSWWISSARDEGLMASINPEGPVGGPSDKKLTGDTKGFEV